MEKVTMVENLVIKVDLVRAIGISRRDGEKEKEKLMVSRTMKEKTETSNNNRERIISNNNLEHGH